MCSTFKGYAAARVLQMVERGQLTLDQKVFVDPAAIVRELAEDAAAGRRRT